MMPHAAPRDVAAITSRGRRRPANEDAVGMAGAVLTGDPVLPLEGSFESALPFALVVADGMGGHPHGALASRETVAELMSDPARLATPEGCSAAIRHAHLHLHELMLRRPETMTMGTTIAGIAVSGDVFCWFNVGDSRIYRLRDACLTLLGHDDRIGPVSRSTGRSAHEILQCLGGQRAIAPIDPHAGAGVLLPGDRLLVCSDGLTDMVADATIAVLLGAPTDAASIAVTLLQAALEAGGRDNISVALVRVPQDGGWQEAGAPTLPPGR